MTDKDQSREAFEAWLIQDRRSRNKALHEWTDEELKGVLLHGSDREWAAWQAARSAPAAPVELPEPVLYSFNEQAAIVVGDEHKFTRTTYTKLKPDEPHTIWYTEEQVRELLAAARRGCEAAENLPETRMDTGADRGRELLPAGWVAVPVEPTKVMLSAAYLVRRNGGLNLDEWNAMLTAAPKLPQGDGWLPIESAPRDGTTVLVYPPTWSNRPCATASYDSDKYAQKPRPYWSRDDALGKVSYSREKPPTHWMPLPQPPKEQG